jgi:hypothetical protein
MKQFQKQILSLIILEGLIFAGFSNVPSYGWGHKKAERVQQEEAKRELALREGVVTKQENIEDTPQVKAPMTLKQVESYGSGAGSLGSFGAPGL